MTALPPTSYPDSRLPTPDSRLPIVLLLITTCLGCGVFDTRDPEEPESGVGTWLQPDTPDRVVRNIQNSIEEMNSRNYLRSLGPDFVFEPTVSARAREPSLWTNWATPEEETYFLRVVASSNFLSGHSLQLLDITESIVDDERSVMYRFESVAAATIAASWMRTPWWTS